MRKPLIVAGTAALTACSPVSHTFVVETRDAESRVVSADVSVCGQPTWLLDRSGTRFVGVTNARCEGSGHIRLRHQDGTTTDCPVGYVTTMDQTLMFVVSGRLCRPDA